MEYKFIYMTLHRWTFRFFTWGWVQRFWGMLKILGWGGKKIAAVGAMAKELYQDMVLRALGHTLIT